MSPKQPFLDLVFLPKVKINGEDWIEKKRIWNLYWRS